MDMKNIEWLLCLFLNICMATGLTTPRQNCQKADITTWSCNYIPQSVPEGFSRVQIADFKRSSKHFKLNSSSFADTSWSNITSLTLTDDTGKEVDCVFMSNCFSKLTALQELKLHITSCGFEPEIFQGTQSVHTLDLSRCHRFRVQQLIEQLNVTNSLPNLQKLYMSEFGTYIAPFSVGSKFVDALLPRNISHVDISITRVTFFNVTEVLQSLSSLRFLNISFSVIQNTWATDITKQMIKHVTEVDFSNAVLPSKIVNIPPGRINISNLTFSVSDLNRKALRGLENVVLLEIINGSHLIPATTVSIWVKNVTIVLDKKLNPRIKEIILRDNNLKYFDVHLQCENFQIYSIIHLDISGNGLEFVHPSVLACFPNLEIVKSSDNNLFKMVNENSSLFEELFIKLKKLKQISLSGNKIQTLPRRMFEKNIDVEIIDLSFNKLEQVHISLHNQQKLRILDLRNNKIKTLDQFSLTTLESIPHTDEKEVVERRQPAVIFSANPISCSQCDTKRFITWLVNAKVVNTIPQKLLCTNEDGTKKTVDESALKQTQTICDRKMKVIIASVSSGVAILIITVVVIVLRKKKKKVQRRQHRERVINKLIIGEGQYEFVVFLAYSSEDDQFVQNNVLNQLNENLQLMTGVDRDLVCTGDRYLRPGCMIHDETVRLLDRASVIIAVVSNNFCRSPYSMNEFDQSYRQRKPIVLMFIEHVDENLMSPALRQLFKWDVRILWTEENGEVVMKTTWENVCTSILDKIQVGE